MTRSNRIWLVLTVAIAAAFFCVATAQAGKPDKPGGGNGGGKGGGGDDGGDAARFSVVELPFEGRYSRISEADLSGVITVAVDVAQTGGTSAAFARVAQDSGDVLFYGLLPEPIYVDPASGFETDGPSNPTDVNSSGQIVGNAGTYDPTTVDNINATRASFWDFDGTNYSMTRLSELPGSVRGSANGINTQGDIVGTMHTSSGDRAVFWDAATLTVADLNTTETAALGWELGYAEDINDNGQIVGWGTHNDEVRGFVLDYATKEITAIPVVDPAHTNVAEQINAQGRVIGNMWDGDGELLGLNPDFHAAFSWEGSGIDPSILSSITDNTSYAMGLNDAEATVGISVIPTDDPFAIYSVPTLWEPDADGVIQAIDLRNEIPAKPSYTLTRAYDINNDGWITARGNKRHKGQYSWPSLLLMPNASTDATNAAFATTAIPEPSSIILFGVAALSVFWISQRNGRAQTLIISGIAFVSMGTTFVDAAQFIPLGYPLGEDRSDANGISPDGAFVVGEYGSVLPEAFRWSESDGFETLGDLPLGFTFDSAHDASLNGEVIVGDMGNESGAREAFRWTATQGIDSLGVLPGMTRSWASAVSADGATVIGSSADDAGDTVRAFRWTEAVGIEELDLGLQPDDFISAFGVSANGSVVVGGIEFGANVSSGHGFRWTQSQGMQALNPLPGDDRSTAFGISADSSVIVGDSLTFDNEGIFVSRRAVRWMEGSAASELGMLPGGENSVGIDASADGSVIIGMSQGEDDVPFLWTEADGMQSLVEVLAGSGIDLTGWELNVSAISDDGSTITGSGRNPNGVREGWVAHLVPTPEPSTFALLILGTAMLSTRRRRHGAE